MEADDFAESVGSSFRVCSRHSLHVSSLTSQPAIYRLNTTRSLHRAGGFLYRLIYKGRIII